MANPFTKEDKEQFIIDMRSLLSDVIEYEEYMCNDENDVTCIACKAEEVSNCFQPFLDSVLPIEDRDDSRPNYQ